MIMICFVLFLSMIISFKHQCHINRVTFWNGHIPKEACTLKTSIEASKRKDGRHINRLTFWNRDILKNVCTSKTAIGARKFEKLKYDYAEISNTRKLKLKLRFDSIEKPTRSVKVASRTTVNLQRNIFHSDAEVGYVCRRHCRRHFRMCRRHGFNDIGNDVYKFMRRNVFFVLDDVANETWSFSVYSAEKILHQDMSLLKLFHAPTHQQKSPVTHTHADPWGLFVNYRTSLWSHYRHRCQWKIFDSGK